MAKSTLTDMQRIILSNAAMRLDRKVLPVPKSLQKGAAAIALSIKPLLGRELVSEVPADREDAVWREDPESGRIGLIITPAGMEAIGVSPDGEGPGGETDRVSTVGTEAAPKAVSATNPSSSANPPRDGSKLAVLIATLSQPAGATVPDMMEATGWQAHSVRGAMSGALKRKLGMTVASEVIEGRGRVYRIEEEAAKAPDADEHDDGDDTEVGEAPVAPISTETTASEAA